MNTCKKTDFVYVASLNLTQLIMSMFQRIMFSVAGTFIYFLDHFKLYSTFCASHCQAQEVLREYYYTI